MAGRLPTGGDRSRAHARRGPDHQGAGPETGTRGSGGDRTLEIDSGAEQLVFDELDGLRDEGYRFCAVSEERGVIATAITRCG